MKKVFVSILCIIICLFTGCTTEESALTTEEITEKFYAAYDFWNDWIYGQRYRGYDDYDRIGPTYESVIEESPIQTAKELKREMKKCFSGELCDKFLEQLAPNDKNGKLYIFCGDVGDSGEIINNITVEKISDKKYQLKLDITLSFTGEKYQKNVYCLLEDKGWVFENDSEDEFFYSWYQPPVAEEESDTPYNEVLKKYYAALWENWEYDKLKSENLNYLVGDGARLVRVGYCFMDINGDGQAELLIGEISNDYWGKVIFDLYTIKNGEAYRIFESDSGCRYSFFEGDNSYKIVSESTPNEDYNCYSYYTIAGSELVLERSVIMDRVSSPDSPWFITNDEDGEIKNDTPINEKEAYNIIESHWINYIKPSFISFGA